MLSLLAGDLLWRIPLFFRGPRSSCTAAEEYLGQNSAEEYLGQRSAEEYLESA